MSDTNKITIMKTPYDKRDEVALRFTSTLEEFKSQNYWEELKEWENEPPKSYCWGTTNGNKYYFDNYHLDNILFFIVLWENPFEGPDPWTLWGGYNKNGKFADEIIYPEDEVCGWKAFKTEAEVLKALPLIEKEADKMIKKHKIYKPLIIITKEYFFSR